MFVGGLWKFPVSFEQLGYGMFYLAGVPFAPVQVAPAATGES